jgi:UDP-N-acetylglucosamine:LPS N-acetylglucosamine transferase
MSSPRKTLAVASKGGHWMQLMRLRPAFADLDVSYVSTHDPDRAEVSGERFFTLPDANRDTPWRMMLLVVRAAILVLRVRPHFVVSTGAAPGYWVCRFAKLLGAKVMWIDSIANPEQLSLSGRRVGSFADVWLTQWESLARPGGPNFRGSVF